MLIELASQEVPILEFTYERGARKLVCSLQDNDGRYTVEVAENGVSVGAYALPMEKTDTSDAVISHAPIKALALLIEQEAIRGHHPVAIECALTVAVRGLGCVVSVKGDRPRIGRYLNLMSDLADAVRLGEAGMPLGFRLMSPRVGEAGVFRRELMPRTPRDETGIDTLPPPPSK